MCYINYLEAPLYFYFVITTFPESSRAPDFLAIPCYSGLYVFTFVCYLSFLPFIKFVGLFCVGSELCYGLTLNLNSCFSEILEAG